MIPTGQVKVQLKCRFETTKQRMTEAGFTLPAFVILSRVPIKGEVVYWTHRGLSVSASKVIHLVSTGKHGEAQALVEVE